MKIFGKGLLLAGIPLLFELGLISTLLSLQSKLELELKQEAHSKSIISHANTFFIERFSSTMDSLAEKLPGVLTTGADEAPIQEKDSNAIAVKELATLKELVKGNKERLLILNHIEKRLSQISQRFESMNSSSGEMISIASSMGDFQFIRKCLGKLRIDINRFVEPEKQLSVRIAAEQIETRQLISHVLSFGLFTSCTLALLFVMLFSRNITSRLDIVIQNTHRLAKKQALEDALAGGNDEIAELDRVFRSMASELTQAYQTLSDSENRLSLIIENVPSGILIVKSDSIIESWNAGAEAIFGKHLEGKSSTDLFGNEQSFSLPEPGQTIALQSLELPGTDGQRKFVELRCADFKTAEDYRFLLMVVDVTEQVRIAQLKKRFIEMLSHDLRTPLTSLQLMLEILLKGYSGQLEEGTLKRLRAGYKNVQHLVALISDLLDIEKCNQGLMELNIEELKCVEVLDMTLDCVESLAENKGINIDYPELNFSFHADKRRLVRVLTNLLSNAIKFSPESSCIKILPVCKEDFFEFHIIDQGPGISQGEQLELFEAYRQTSTGKYSGAGTGLGLACCKAIIEAHKGCIGVTSEEGKGCDFWIRLYFTT